MKTYLILLKLATPDVTASAATLAAHKALRRSTLLEVLENVKRDVDADAKLAWSSVDTAGMLVQTGVTALAAWDAVHRRLSTAQEAHLVEVVVLELGPDCAGPIGAALIRAPRAPRT